MSRVEMPKGWKFSLNVFSEHMPINIVELLSTSLGRYREWYKYIGNFDRGNILAQSSNIPSKWCQVMCRYTRVPYTDPCRRETLGVWFLGKNFTCTIAQLRIRQWRRENSRKFASTVCRREEISPTMLMYSGSTLYVCYKYKHTHSQGSRAFEPDLTQFSPLTLDNYDFFIIVVIYDGYLFYFFRMCRLLEECFSHVAPSPLAPCLTDCKIYAH